jgi:electron transfer flavoprotein alpha/beta subunit
VQDGSPDLIFCGKQSIDTEGMQTPFRLMKAFYMPSLPMLSALA